MDMDTATGADTDMDSYRYGCGPGRDIVIQQVGTRGRAVNDTVGC